MSAKEIKLKEREISSDQALKGLLNEGEWFQCQGVPEVYEGKKVDKKLRESRGHAILHVTDEEQIDMITYATPDSLRKPGKEPVYPVHPRILPRIKIDFGNPKGYERCPTCQHLLKIHQGGESFSKSF